MQIRKDQNMILFTLQGVTVAIMAGSAGFVAFQEKQPK